MIYLGETLRVDGFPDAPRKICECFERSEVEVEPVFLDEDEPVATPRNVAPDHTVAGNIDGHLAGFAERRNVLHRNRAIRV